MYMSFLQGDKGLYVWRIGIDGRQTKKNNGQLNIN
jgi:hypothetical protein